MAIRKAVNFDLDTKAMKEKLGSKTLGYYLVEETMKKLGFIHRQGSGYISKKPMTKQDVQDFVQDLAKANIWLEHCVEVLDITDIPTSGYDFTKTLVDCAKQEREEMEMVQEKQLDSNEIEENIDEDERDNPKDLFLENEDEEDYKHEDYPTNELEMDDF